MKISSSPVLLGGFGEKKSNGGTQWFFQDRVYSSFGMAVAISASVMPLYLTEESDGSLGIERREFRP
jgi:hypothetical protein